MPDNLQAALMAYGSSALAKAARASPDEAARLFPSSLNRDAVWPGYVSVLSAGNQRPPEPVLSSIFSCVVIDDQSMRPPPMAYHAAPLALGDVLFPVDHPSARAPGASLWRDFVSEAALLPSVGDARCFEAFYHLYLKYAWAVPCSYGEPGVSLFEQWKAVAALAFAGGDAWTQGPAASYTLIGGDIPGIQDFVYTITSKGAAKGLRGRSFFLQLLSDSVVRRVIADLDISVANVVYNAGGNFMVLGPALANGQPTGDVLLRLERGINADLLELYGGDLSISLASVELGRDIVGNDNFDEDGVARLRHRQGEAKRRRFATVAGEQWERLFAASGQPGNSYCTICHRPLARNTGDTCDACDGFEKLAQRLGRAGMLRLTAGRRGNEDSWQEALQRISGWWYHILDASSPAQGAGDRTYLLNDCDFLKHDAVGYRFTANVTPHVTASDVQNWLSQERSGAEQPVAGQMRTVSDLAEASRGVPWLGILRMDVDNLGQIMARGLAARTLTTISALSGALEVFFGGWLNALSAGVNSTWPSREEAARRGERIYIIYAGGDDLFAVGAWDTMPELAYRIRQDFARYTGGNAALHLSAGLTLHDASFPIYQAAEQAGEAEDAAKSHHQGNRSKDSISFLGTTVFWNEWPDVLGLVDRVVGAVERKEAPHALIGLLQDIHTQYEESVRRRNRRELVAGRLLPKEPPTQFYYGPWVWRRVYALSRMEGRVKGDAPALLRDLREASLSAPALRRIALAARWAELLLRKEG